MLKRLDNPCSEINITMEPLPPNEMITSFRLFDFSDWRLSKRIILRMVEAMPMLRDHSYITSSHFRDF